MTRSLEDLRATCRRLWNDFDPIGVVPDGIEDEYEAYLPHTVQLVEDGADSYRFRQYLAGCVFTNMGLSANPQRQDRIAAFAETLASLARKEAGRE